MRKIVAIAIWGISIVVSVLALAGIFFRVGLADQVWSGQFSNPGQSYLAAIDDVFAPLDRLTKPLTEGALPFWVLHTLVLYLSVAAALLAGRWAFVKKPAKTNMFGTLLSSLFWPYSLIRGLTKSGTGSASFAKLFLGYALLTGLGYGGARLVNARSVIPAYESFASDAQAEESAAIDVQCTEVMNSHARSRRYLQDNFDAALDGENWDKAQDVAWVMGEMSACLSTTSLHMEQVRAQNGLPPFSLEPRQRWIDITRVNFGIADSFYRRDQWRSAWDYYADGLTSFDRLLQDYRGKSGFNPDPAAGLELSVLFNNEVVYVHRLRQLETLHNMIPANQADDFDLIDIENAIFQLRQTRNRYGEDVVHNSGLKKMLQTNGLDALDSLIDLTVSVAERQSSPEGRIRAAQHLKIELDEVEEFYKMYIAGQEPVSYAEGQPQYYTDLWYELEDRIFEKREAGNSALTASHLTVLDRLVHREITSKYIYANEGIQTLGDEHRPVVEKGLELANRLIRATEELDFYDPPAVLGLRPFYQDEAKYAATRKVIVNDPYPVYVKLARLLDRDDDAYAALEPGIYYNLKHQLRLHEEQYQFEQISTEKLHELGNFTADYLAAGTEVDKQQVLKILNGTSAPDPNGMRENWADLISRLCKKFEAENQAFGDATCEELLAALMIEGLVTPFEKVIIASPAPALAPVEYVVVDLLFGTTRKYDPDSLSPETFFTRKDEPDGYGRRGSVTLQADRSLLGPPLLADAFAKGENRAKLFNFTEDPDVFGHDAAAIEKFKRVLRERLASAKRDEVLIYIHGVGSTFPGAAKRTAQLTYDLSFPGESMFYSWPTEDNFLGYFKDIDVPQMAIDDVARFIREASESTGKVNIIAHSHGARVTVDSLTKLIADMENEGKTLALGQVILAAPDVDGNKLRSAVDKHLSQVADRVTIYSNDSDKALWLSSMLRIFKWRGGLGKSDTTCAAQLIDASSAVPFGSHSYFAKESEVIADIRTLIWHRGVNPDQRCYLERRDEKRGAAWKFSKERCDITAYDIASQISIREQEGQSEEFNNAFIALLGDKNIKDATDNEESADSAPDGEQWKVINASVPGADAVTATLVSRKRYDKAVEHYSAITNSGAASSGAPCAP